MQFITRGGDAQFLKWTVEWLCAYVETGELTSFKLVNHVWLLIKQSTTALLKFNKSKFTQWHRSNCYGLKIYPSPQEKILPHFENVISNAKELGCVTMGGDEVTRMKWNDRCRYLRPVSIIKGRAEGPFVSLFMLFPPFIFCHRAVKEVDISLDFLASRTMSQHRSAHKIPSQVLWKRVTNRLRRCLMNKTSQIQSIRLYNRENVLGLAGLDHWITISGVNELKEQSVLGKSSTYLFPVEAQDVTIISTKLSSASLSLDEGDTITLRIHFIMPTSHWFVLLTYIYGFWAWSSILNCK